MKDIQHVLNDFAPIILSEMDEKKLMNRTDTKFVFPQLQLPLFLKELKHDYQVLDVEGNRISRYESLYFDTPDFDLYHQHQRGKLNRHKIRYRKYVESDLNFFEIKLKNNKSRTIKDRVVLERIQSVIIDKAEELLSETTRLRAQELEPKFWVNFSRITLVNMHCAERTTFDLDLNFHRNGTQNYVENLVIAEVKQESNGHSPFIRLMKKHHVRPGSLSKYCFGVISLFKDMKQNNFKRNLRKINKVIYGTAASA
jgi:hypothetical protein